MPRRLVLVVATLIAFLGTGAAASAAPYQVLQVNLCGSGYAPCFGQGTTDKAAKAAELIRATQPTAVTLNEMCRGDIARIGAAAGGYRGSFSQAGTRRCRNGEPYGIGVLFPPSIVPGRVNRAVYSGQQSGPEQRVIHCQEAAGVRVCTTHLDHKGKQGQQALEMRRRFAQALAQGRKLVLGGDWNLSFGGRPDAQRFVPEGMARQGDGAVQHVMVSRRDFAFRGQRRIALDWTDHPGLLVTYDVR